MSDTGEALRRRLDTLFETRAERVRRERERREEARRRRASYLRAFQDRIEERVAPVFEVAARTVEAHGFEGRVRQDLEPEEGGPWIRFEMHPGDVGNDGPVLGRATLRYRGDPYAERVVVERSVGGGDGDVFAQEGHEAERLRLDDLGAERIEEDLAVLVARAIHVEEADSVVEENSGPVSGAQD
ncbi:MAG: hypothetical protein WD336_04225 [Trueperaceae bacterium]